MTDKIRAIETAYAGCRFRSRLEARWAVFFDHLGIRWEYEPQGLDLDGVRYLPDFYLPDLMRAFVEVKGDMDERGMEKVLALAGAAHTVLVLQDIPRPDALGPHFNLFRKRRNGRVVSMWVSLFPAAPDDTWVLIPFGWEQTAPDDPAAAVAWGMTMVDQTRSAGNYVLSSEPVSQAFAAARSARFEFGESGYSSPFSPPGDPW